MYEKKGIHYNISESLFEQEGYFSYSKTGSVLVGPAYNPDGGTGFDISRRISLKKAYAESVERRSLIIKYNSDKLINCINLIDMSIALLEERYFYYYDNDPVIDSTATAAHVNGQLALSNAIEELFQKNSLFLMWYFRRVYKLKNKERILVNLDFLPWITILLWEKVDGDIFLFTGLGTGLSYMEALHRAKIEIKTLKKQYTNNHYVGNSKFKIEENQKTSNYLKSLIESAQYISESNIFNGNNVNIRFAIKKLPSWIRTLYVSKTINNLSYVNVLKVFSNELISCIPTKDNLLKVHQTEVFFKVYGFINISSIPNCTII